MRVLVVGGCHLASLHLQARNGITEHLRGHIGALADITAIDNFDIDRAIRAMRVLRTNPPDVLVIQPGGSSCPKDVRARIRHHPLLKRSKVTATIASPSSLPTYSSGQRLRRSLLWWLRDIGKLLLDAFCAFTKRPLADIDRLEVRTIEFINFAKSCGVQDVILLTPLPCADTVGRRYRRLLADRYRRIWFPPGVQLLDVQGMEEFRNNARQLLADTRHLNAPGNKAVAKAIAERIREIESMENAVKERRYSAKGSALLQSTAIPA